MNVMRRTLCAMLFAIGVPAQAQQLEKPPRMGLLSTSLMSALTSRVGAFRHGQSQKR